MSVGHLDHVLIVYSSMISMSHVPSSCKQSRFPTDIEMLSLGNTFSVVYSKKFLRYCQLFMLLLSQTGRWHNVMFGCQLFVLLLGQTGRWHNVMFGCQLFMLLLGQTGRWLNVLNLSFRPSFVRLLPNLWTRYYENQWISFDANYHNWSMEQGHETVNLGGQQVKGQGHTRPKIDLECWQTHHSRLPWVE